ncbi:MAG TPA: adenylosuccinate synthase [Bacteroidales bacterium]|nr:adenylosuccinate synthase [Bacteroidales bacterium]
MNKATKADVLLGLQWGDEGKGKIVDVISPEYDVVARFQGGPNAGHTLEFDGKKFVLHTIPSGIFHKECMNLVGNGVVVDPVILAREIVKTGLSFEEIRKRLLFSAKAHLILPSHRLADSANEALKGANKIGSTLKGIGPAYTDKIARTGLRIGDISYAHFREKYNLLKKSHLSTIRQQGFSENDFKIENLSFSQYEEKWFEGLAQLQLMQIVEAEMYINESLGRGLRVLAEGAQGTLLDVDFGSYPFVTSSNTIAAGACTGLGVAPSRIGEVLGIFKAYCTRVGSGPFPTELFDRIGEILRKTGNEFGATTGRPRRCGWLDLPALKYATMLNGTTGLFITKVDVLNAFDNIQVCTGYIYEGMSISYVPTGCQHEKLQPVYRQFDGWQCDLSGVGTFNDLPPQLQSYIKFIEDFVEVPVVAVSTGSNRDEILFRK